MSKKPKRKKPQKLTQKFQRELTRRSWQMMLQRCQDPRHVSYHHYGGRGILVQMDWTPQWCGSRMIALHNFIRDVGLRPSQAYTLDREDANKHYTKGNVRWATALEQGANKRTTHRVLHPRTRVPVAASLLAAELGIPYHSLRQRMIKAGTWYEIAFIKPDSLNTTQVSDDKDPEETA